jgi:hypothetical protein
MWDVRILRHNTPEEFDHLVAGYEPFGLYMLAVPSAPSVGELTQPGKQRLDLQAFVGLKKMIDIPEVVEGEMVGDRDEEAA